MDVEKAISAVGRSFNFTPNFVATSEDRDGVINLLKEGDKYKKILAEVEERLIPGKIIKYDTRINISNLGALDLIKMIIEDVKQKYFPRVYKRKFVIELETEDVHAIRNADSHIRSRFGDTHFFGCEVKMREDRG